MPWPLGKKFFRKISHYHWGLSLYLFLTQCLCWCLSVCVYVWVCVHVRVGVCVCVCERVCGWMCVSVGKYVCLSLSLTLIPHSLSFSTSLSLNTLSLSLSLLPDYHTLCSTVLSLSLPLSHSMSRCITWCSDFQCQVSILDDLLILGLGSDSVPMSDEMEIKKQIGPRVSLQFLILQLLSWGTPFPSPVTGDLFI